MRLFIVLLVVHQIFADTELTEKSFASGLNGFSFEFAKQMDYANDNIIFSPLGIATVMGMLLEAPKSNTSEMIFKMLNMEDYSNKDMIHNCFKGLMSEYKDMATREQNPRNVTIEMSNALLYAENYKVPETYTNALKEKYDASVSAENFAANGEQIMEKINTFVKQRTHDLIPKILSKPLDSATIMTMINTIYFKGFWEHEFNKMFTYNATFYNADKREKTVEMMTKEASSHKYYHCDVHKAQLIELKYKGDVSMFVLLPDDKNGLPKLIEGWSKDKLASFIPQMNDTLVAVHLPKFDIDRKLNLLAQFDKMGVDIRPALKTVDPSLEISSGSHMARIKVWEAGTEAAAVTFLTITRISAIQVPEPVHFRADHPFAYCIRDMKSAINLFCGVVNKFE